MPLARSTGTSSTPRRDPPAWIKPHLAALVKGAPDGPGWLHEIELDGYRMHARLDAGFAALDVQAGRSGRFGAIFRIR
jgi:ATP-dependent DNA ligase